MGVMVYLLPVVLLVMLNRSLLQAWQKFILLLIGLGMCTETMMAMYVTYTPVGHSEVLGVQGRQFLPVILCLLWPLSFSLSSRFPFAVVVESLFGYIVPLLFVWYCLAYKMLALGY